MIYVWAPHKLLHFRLNKFDSEICNINYRKKLEQIRDCSKLFFDSFFSYHFTSLWLNKIVKMFSRSVANLINIL